MVNSKLPTTPPPFNRYLLEFLLAGWIAIFVFQLWRSVCIRDILTGPQLSFVCEMMTYRAWWACNLVEMLQHLFSYGMVVNFLGT